jgi:uncharacterized protein
VIVADTGAIVALVDRKDRHHRILKAAFEESAGEWILPWAILPEVDYLLGAHVSASAQAAFFADVAEGAFLVEWGNDEDVAAAERLTRQYAALRLGLVDAVVMATASRKRARAIATLDVRDFGAVKIAGSPRLWPRDL